MKENETVLEDWLVRAKRKTNAHARCASHFEFCHRAIGVPLVALSAITGTTVVAQYIDNDPKWWGVTLVVLTAILTSLQTFFDYGARAEKHKSVSASFSNLRREIQCVIDKPEFNQSDYTRLGEIFDNLVGGEPIIPHRIWKDVENKYPRPL